MLSGAFSRVVLTTAVSPLAVEGVDLGLTQAEIVEFVQAGRRVWDGE
jgi:hypothetical protein